MSKCVNIIIKNKNKNKQTKKHKVIYPTNCIDILRFLLILISSL